MELEKVVPNVHEEQIEVSGTELNDLVRQARESDERDRTLTVRQALKQYKGAVFWAMFLSTSLIMEGFDLVTINSFYGQEQFQARFVVDIPGKPGTKAIPPSWQSGLSNSALVGQLAGMMINAYTQDRFGCRPTMMFFMGVMTLTIFIPFFAPSLPILAFGESMCGIPWGVFQTLSTTYACEIVPTILRPYVTAYVCMCWGAGILLSSGVIRAVAGIPGDLAWRLPFALQWVWPIPIMIGTYFAPESPWNAVRRGNFEEAKKSLMRPLPSGEDLNQRVEYTMAYIRYNTQLEIAETGGATFLDCFPQILCGNPLLGFSVVFLVAAGFTSIQAFNVNISLSACYIVGGVICWFLFPRLGRATIYMAGMTAMFFTLLVIGGLAFSTSSGAKTGIAVLFVVSTLFNMTTIGPACYPIVAETPSGRLRYKTITIGRIVYNLTGIVSNVLTPRMVSEIGWNWGAKTALFYAGTNLLMNILKLHGFESR